MGAIMKIEVVTSFNQRYYDMIGRAAVDSYLRYWSTDITVYAEECQVTPQDRVRVIDFDQLDPDYATFSQDTTQSKRCRIFAKKAFCVIHGMYHSQADWLVWLDADTLTQRSDPAQKLEKLLDDSILAMYMGVRYHDHKGKRFGDWLVPETGFFAVNLKHAQTSEFRDEYRRRYIERDFDDLRRSYDNDVFGAVVETVPAKYLDLCSHLTKPYKTPLKHTLFGEYLQHYKAKHSKRDYAEAQ